MILSYKITFKLLHQVKHNVIALLTDSALKLLVLLKKIKWRGWSSLSKNKIFPLHVFVFS